MTGTTCRALAAALVLGGVPAQDPAPRSLTVAELFALPDQLRGRHIEPLEWVDDDHYLAFDVMPGAADSGKRFFLQVHATSGKVETLFDPGLMASAIAEAVPGFSSALAAAAVHDRSRYVWGPGHARLVLHAAGDLISYVPATRTARRLTDTPGPEVGAEFSPDGRMVAFVHDYDLHVVAVDGGAPRALTEGGNADLLFGRLDWVYQEELYGRGNFKGYWWSPDSARIAFLRLDEAPVKEFTLVGDTPTRPVVEVANYPKAGDPNPGVALGVAPARGGAVRYLDLSRYGTQDILISRVAWHPDGSEVYIQVQDRAQRWLDLLAGNPDTGEVRVVLHERSQSWVEADANPWWIAGGAEFLWLSERDGFKHLYRYARDGSLRMLLTRGEFEVDEVVGVDEKAEVVFFHTDRTSILEQHLWRVGFDGKAAGPVTKGRAWHTARFSPGLTKFLHSWSSIDEREGVQVCDPTGATLLRVTTGNKKLLESYQLSPVEFVQVPNRDGFKMEAMLIKPRGFKEGQKYPVMCYTYSGPHAPQVRARWGGRRYLWHQLLAQRGYMVFVCDNRSASGKGLKSASTCFEKLGTTELSDLEDAVKWLVSQGAADPKRIGIWGWSYGGYQTSFCLTHSKVWSLGIAVNPVTDWRLYDSIYTERYMGLPQANPDGYAASSVLRAAGDLHGKLLLVAATMDDNVHMQNSLQFAHALQKAGKQFRFMAYPRVRHGIEDDDQQRHLYEMMTAFVVDNL